MKTHTRTNLDVFVLLASVGLTELSLELAMWLRILFPLTRPLDPGSDFIPPGVFLAVGVIWFVVFMVFSTARLVRVGTLIEELWRLAGAVGMSALLFAGVLFLSFRGTSRLYYIYFVLVDIVVVTVFFVAMRAIIRRQSRRSEIHSRVVIVGAGSTGLRIANALRGRWGTTQPVIGFLDDDIVAGSEIDGWPVLGGLADVDRVIAEHTVDELIVALPLEAHPKAVALVRRLQSTPIHIRLVPDFLGFAVINANVEYLEGLPVVGLRVPAIGDEARIAKRLFDIIVSASLLLVLSPALILIALFVRLDSAGRALYLSDRVGENGRLFKMYKFRTMVSDADAQWEKVANRRDDGKLTFKSPDDPRITRVGQWLRRTSLDELPQLVNVLKGDMSLVGPRPELPAIVREEYEPWQWGRFTVPQGMTGWWQINRRGFEHQHLCTADDLYYIQNYSLLLDIKILFRTVVVVLAGQGAY